MKLPVATIAFLLMFSPLAVAQSNNNNGTAADSQKTDDCTSGLNTGSDTSANQSLRCKTENKAGTATDGQNTDTTGSTNAPQRKHNSNDAVPEAEQP